MSISDGQQMARRLDGEGIRTIGCITKIDIMDRGTNARKMLMNEEIPLKLGYIGIKGRSQEDIKNNMQVKEALEAEKKYFASSSIYSNQEGKCGTTAQVGILTSTMYKHIRRILPDIIREIDDKMFECEDNLKDQGNPMPQDEKERLKMLWGMISVFCDRFKASILSQYNDKSGKHKTELMGGAKINIMNHDQYNEYLKPNFKASKKFYSDKNIQHALKTHQGDSLPGFLTSGAFMSLVMPLMEKLKEPALNLLTDIHSCMEGVALSLVNDSFARFPSLVNEISDTILGVIAQEKEKAREIIENILNAECEYLYTRDPEYIQLIYEGWDKKEGTQAERQNDNQADPAKQNQDMQNNQYQLINSNAKIANLNLSFN